MLDTIVSILLFVLSFGVLICIHELGHLATAKIFGVYCREYSIGFGPAIFSKKPKNKETRFSIRAVPLGGYVSMYGEGMEEDEEFKDIPKERSLEGIKKWKKAIILSAGVILNAILAFILIFISNMAFPLISNTRTAIVAENSLIAEAGVVSGDHISFILPDEYVNEDGTIRSFTYEFTDDEKVIHAASFYIVDVDATFNEEKVVLAFAFNGNKNDPKFSDGLILFNRTDNPELLKHDTQLKADFIKWRDSASNPSYFPDFEKGVIGYKEGAENKLYTKVKFAEHEDAKSLVIPGNSSKYSVVFDDVGLSFARKEVWLSAGERFHNTFVDYGSAAGAVFKCFGVLFSGGIKNMSGIVGIFSTSATLYSQYTFSFYLYFWGLISVNLAIFNLLPFPGLDGWQLLVTAVEGIFHKKIPQKVKSIVSIVGLALLFVLMIVIVVLDVIRIVG